MENYYYPGYQFPLKFINKKSVISTKSIHSNKYKFIKYDYSDTYYVEKNNKKIPLPSIEEIIKNATKYSKQNMLSCFIQYLLEKEDEDGIENFKNKILDSIKEDLYDLSTNFYGNYVIQGILHNIDKEKNKYIFNKLIKKDILKLCFNTYGCRVVQKLIENSIGADEIREILKEIKENKKLKDFFLDQNGNHVIQKIIEKLNEGELTDIYNAVLEDIPKLVKNIYGSHIIEALLKKLQNKENIINIVDEIFKNDIFELCKDQYGNYVLGVILDKNHEYVKTVFEKIKGHIYELSENKFALYSFQIIEKLIFYGNEEHKKQICEEILKSDDKDNNYILRLINDKCGIFLIGIIIDFCSEDIIKEIFKRIKKKTKEIKKNFFFIIHKAYMRGIYYENI